MPTKINDDSRLQNQGLLYYGRNQETIREEIRPSEKKFRRMDRRKTYSKVEENQRKPVVN